MRVSYKSNAAQLTLRTSQRLQQILPAIRKAEEQSGRIISQRAVSLSQGPYSTAQLRQMGHPYGWGRVPPANPAIINAQTRRFQGSWKYQTELTGNTVSLFVFNDAPYAKYMRGTQKMIPRQILELLVKLEAPGRFQRLRASFGNVFRSG